MPGEIRPTQQELEATGKPYLVDPRWAKKKPNQNLQVLPPRPNQNLQELPPKPNRNLQELPPKRRSFEDQLGENMKQWQEDGQYSYDYPQPPQKAAPLAPRQGMMKVAPGSKDWIEAYNSPEIWAQMKMKDGPVLDLDMEETARRKARDREMDQHLWERGRGPRPPRQEPLTQDLLHRYPNEPPPDLSPMHRPRRGMEENMQMLRQLLLD